MKEALALVAMMLLGIFAALGWHIQAFSIEVPASTERLRPVYSKIDDRKKNNDLDKLENILSQLRETKKTLSPTTHTHKSLTKIEEYVEKKKPPVFVVSSSASLSDSVVKALAEMFWS